MRSELPAHTIRPTARELVILELLTQDLTNVQIAKRLFIGEQTVKTYMRRLISLSKVNTRLGLAVMFIRWRDLGVSNPYWDEPEIVYSQVGGKGSGHP